MKTRFELRPQHEKDADSQKMLAVVLRPGFNLDAYWKKVRRDIAQNEGKR